MSYELDRVLALAQNLNSQTVALSGDSLAVLFFVEEFLSTRRTWIDQRNRLDTVTDDEWDTIDALVSKAYEELLTPMLGQVVAYITASPPSNVLPCDGTVYNRVDYPELYAVLDLSLIHI